TAELYDPVAGTWATTGTLSVGRTDLPADLMPINGKVIAPGGHGAGPTADAYDPWARTWTATSSMNSSRAFHGSSVVPVNGKLLISGGVDDPNSSDPGSCELYNTPADLWSFTASLEVPRKDHTQTLLPINGRVLVVGGDNPDIGALSEAEEYEP